MADPWRIYILFSDTGTIRKWDVKPFEIDGVRATEFHAASVHGLHTCSDTCDRPLCVLRRENERQHAEIERLREANGVLEDALQEVGDDYPGSSCQEWCQQQVRRARLAVMAAAKGGEG